MHFFNCSKDSIFTIISDNPILQRLREEKEHKISGGFYHELQIRMTYNLNQIEGSTLNEEQTRIDYNRYIIKRFEIYSTIADIN